MNRCQLMIHVELMFWLQPFLLTIKKNESGYVIIFVKGLAFMLDALMTWAFTSET